MREKLQAIDGRRCSFTATFKRFGTKPAYKGPPIKTVLLVDVKDGAGLEVCDHIWFVCSSGFAALDLKEGDQVAFDARSKPYVKGYRGHRHDDWDLPGESLDYKLSHPTKVRRVCKQAEPENLQLL